MTANTYQTPAPLNTYLRRATFGLSAQHREEVWNELEEHILCRAEKLEFQGLSAEQALKQALREMGPPQRVCWQLNGVHNMPKLIAFGGLATLILSTTFLVLANTTNKNITLPAIIINPKQPYCLAEGEVPKKSALIFLRQNGKVCYTSNMPYNDDKAWGSYISLDNIKLAYEKAGIKADFEKNNRLKIIYPNKRERIIDSEFIVNHEGYTKISNLIISNLREENTSDLTLKGYDNPSLSLGEINIQLGTSSQPVFGADFYRDLSGWLLRIVLNGNIDKGELFYHDFINHRSKEAKTSQTLTIQTGLKRGEVVMLIMPMRIHSQKTYFTDIACVGADGKATLLTRSQNLSFAKDIKQFFAPNTKKTPALLVRLTHINLHNLQTGILSVN